MRIGFRPRMGFRARGTAQLPATVTGTNATFSGTVVATTEVQTASMKADSWRRFTPGGRLNIGLAAGTDAALDVNVDMAQLAGRTWLLDPATTRGTTPPIAFTGDLDLGFSRSAANNFLMSGSLNGTVAIFTGNLQTPNIYIVEGAAPTGVANYSLLYSVDVATKTQLTVIFGSGAAQQIKIEA